jgi:hypothetical protein
MQGCDVRNGIQSSYLFLSYCYHSLDRVLISIFDLLRIDRILMATDSSSNYRETSVEQDVLRCTNGLLIQSRCMYLIDPINYHVQPVGIIANLVRSGFSQLNYYDQKIGLLFPKQFVS